MSQPLHVPANLTDSVFFHNASSPTSWIPVSTGEQLAERCFAALQGDIRVATFGCLRCQAYRIHLLGLCWSLMSPSWRIYRRQMLAFQATVQDALEQYVANALDLFASTTDGPKYHMDRSPGSWLEEFVSVTLDAQNW